MNNTPDKQKTTYLQTLTVEQDTYAFYSLKAAHEIIGHVEKLPFCIRVFLENLLKHQKSLHIAQEDIQALCAFHALKKNPPALTFKPSHLLMNENEALSALTDMASVESEIQNHSPTPIPIELPCPLDIIINKTKPPYTTNRERMMMMRWSEQHFTNLRIIPAEKGISGPINVDYLCDLLYIEPTTDDKPPLLSSNTFLGSERTLSMHGAMGGLSWQGDVLDVETVLLNGSLKLTIPSVLGVKLTGTRNKNISASDIALALREKLAEEKLSGKFIEFLGEGLDQLSLSDRAIITNILNQTDALGIFFPLDAHTLKHFSATGRTPSQIKLYEAFAKEQGWWRDGDENDAQAKATYSSTTEFELNHVKSGVWGIEDNQSFTQLTDVAESFSATLPAAIIATTQPLDELHYGDIIYAEISPSSSAHPQELIAAGLLAKKAKEKGLYLKPWVHGHLGFGTPHIKDYLEALGLLNALQDIGFSCEPKGLSDKAKETLLKGETRLASIRSGYDNDDPLSGSSGLSLSASPLLVVIYGLAGSLSHDFLTRPIGASDHGKPHLLKDIWPNTNEIAELYQKTDISPFISKQKDTLLTTSPEWENLIANVTPTFYPWNKISTCIKISPLAALHSEKNNLTDIKNARVLAMYGDDIESTTIIPQGDIAPESPAGAYLQNLGLTPEKLGKYQSYSGNYEVMMRGALAGKGLETDTTCSLYEVATRYHEEKTPVIILAGQNFGGGTQQEWAAKAIKLMGIAVVIADSYAPAFRKNLIRVGVLPLQMKQGSDVGSLNIKASDRISIIGFSLMTQIPAELLTTIEQRDDVSRYMLSCALKNDGELEMFKKDGMWNAYIKDKVG